MGRGRCMPAERRASGFSLSNSSWARFNIPESLPPPEATLAVRHGPVDATRLYP